MQRITVTIGTQLAQEIDKLGASSSCRRTSKVRDTVTAKASRTPTNTSGCASEAVGGHQASGTHTKAEPFRSTRPRPGKGR